MTATAAAPIRAARWQHELADGRIQCDLCPRHCRLRDGQRGYCFVRERRGGAIELSAYGRASGFAVDPIEKKPLNHVLPGADVLSFGTAGCNLGCRYCQNWAISTSRHYEALAAEAPPRTIAREARRRGCQAVAFTYNDPVIFAEYAIDTALACRELGVHPIAVTAGYIGPEARGEFFGAMDAANVDLKGFSDDFYFRLTGGAHLRPVLDTLTHLAQTDCWYEITNLVIPGHNDDEAETRTMSRWIRTELGPDVPVHFTAFHPDFKMMDVPRTPIATLRRAREIALEEGLHYVYIGNAYDDDGASTLCPSCGAALITRSWHAVMTDRIAPAGFADGACPDCGERIPGRF